MKEQFIRTMKIFCFMMCMTIIGIGVISIQVDAESYQSMYNRAVSFGINSSGQVYTEEIDGVLWRVSVDENKNVFIDSEKTLPENVVIPEIVAGYRVTNIGMGAFDNHQEIKNITIPSGVTTIHQFAFTQCFNLININVVPENQVFTSLDGVLYTKQKDVLVSFPNGRTGSYKIPSGVKAIRYSAFDDALLNELWIPESVGAIGGGAFNPCNDTSPYGVYQPLTKIYYEGNYEEVSELYDGLGYYYYDPDKVFFEKDIENIYFLAPDCQIESEKTKYSQFRYEEIKPIEVKNGSTDKYQNNVSYVGGDLTYQWYRGSVLYKEVSYADYVESASRREIDWDQTLANSELLAGETESSYIPSFRNHSKEPYFCIITNNYMGESYKTVSNVVEIEFAVPEVQVTFNCNGGSSLEAEKVTYGDQATWPEIPIKEGYLFNGWYVDQEGTIAYDFSKPVIEDLILYAKWDLDYSQLIMALEDANSIINSGAYKNDIKFKLYKAAVKKGEIMVKERNAMSPEEIQEQILKIKTAEGKLSLI